MKGENISPNRQGSKRLHRRKSVVGFSAARNSGDIAAAAADAELDSDEEDGIDLDAEVEDVVVVVPPPASPDNPKSFVRRKSVLPQDIQVVQALEDYQTHELRADASKGLRRVDSGRVGFASSPKKNNVASTHDVDADDLADDTAQGYLDVTSGEGMDADNDSDEGEQTLTGFSSGETAASDASPTISSGGGDTGNDMMGWGGIAHIDDAPSTAGAWFTKRKAAAFGRSRKRWFILDELNRKIMYYVDDVTGKVPGPTDVRGMIELKTIKSATAKDKVLVIATTTRTFQLTATTSLITAEWKKKIDELNKSSISRDRDKSVYGFGSGDELNKGADDSGAADTPVLTIDMGHDGNGELVQGNLGSNSLGMFPRHTA